MLGRWGLRLMGWRFEGNMPSAPKLILAVAPHTSNWDFIVGFLAYLALQLDATWFGKHTLFRWPMGPVLRHFGGIPVERSQKSNVVDMYVAEFGRRERMVLALAPEGTRKRIPEWKTGFYHIGVGSGAALVPVAFDYSARTIRLMPPFEPTGEVTRDLPRFKALFRPEMAKFPAQF